MQTKFTVTIDAHTHSAVLINRAFVLDTFRKVPLNKYDAKPRFDTCTHAVVVGMPTLYEDRSALAVEVHDDGTVHLEF